MSTRWLKHTGNGTVWPWTPTLARRSDMMEVAEGAQATDRTGHASDPTVDPTVPQEADEVDVDIRAVVLAFKTKDELAEFAEGHGVKVDKRKGIDAMRAEVFEALGVDL